MIDNPTSSSNGKAHGKDSSFTTRMNGHLNELQMQLPTPQPNQQTSNFDAELEALRVRPTDIIEEAPTCLTIEQDGKSYSIASMGNLSTIAGKAKARKTFAVSVAVAAAVASSLILNRIRGNLPTEQQTVLLFDTEQARHHVLKVVKRICKLSNLDTAEPENLVVYAMRPIAPKDRLTLINHAINNTPNLGLVIIDGIRDLAIDPVLDAEQASHLMTHLLQWTDRLNIHILCVLHQNKGDSNLRGHIGTELANKSETVIMVSRDTENKEVSIVSPEHCRDREFEAFGFSIDEQGLPYLADDASISTSSEKRNKKPTVDTMSTEDIVAILKRVFSDVDTLQYSKLLIAVIEASEFIGKPLAESRAQTFIQRVYKTGHLTKSKQPNQRYETYQLATKNPSVLPSP